LSTDTEIYHFVLSVSTICSMSDGVAYAVVADSSKSDGGHVTEIADVEMVQYDANLEESKEKVPTHANAYSPILLRSVLNWMGFHVKTQAEMDAENNAPQLPFWKIFKLFFWFGCRAFGGKTAPNTKKNSSFVS